MSAMSNYLEEAILNAVFRGQSFTPPSSVYVALYVDNPTENDTGTEVSGGGYERQEVTFSAPTQDGSRAVISNQTEIVFDVATDDWGTVTHVGIRDAKDGGNLLYYGELESSREVLESDQLKFNVGALQLSID